MEEIKELIELANKIQDKKLREKVIEFLKNPSLSHPEFKKYPKSKIKETKVYFSTPFGTSIREVYLHTIALTQICIKVAELIEENYGIKLNKDHLIAASLLHDLMKIFEWKIEDNLPKHTGISLDHSSLAIAELYHRNFPEHVIHIIAAHFGEQGPTRPRTAEAFIFHHLDSMLSLFESHLSPKEDKIPVIVIDEETLKSLKKERENDK